uniref:Uncharacterized protein n=1 Tax=Oryza nivara TaxID=4536 RepID=A0A0E0ITI7_ORYNI
MARIGGGAEEIGEEGVSSELAGEITAGGGSAGRPRKTGGVSCRCRAHERRGSAARSESGVAMEGG